MLVLGGGVFFCCYLLFDVYFMCFLCFCGFLPLDLLFGFCSCVRFLRCWFIVVSCMLCLICQWSPNIVCILYVDYTLLLWECCVGGVWVCVLWLKSQTGNTLMIKMALGTAPHNVYWAPRPQWLKCFKKYWAYMCWVTRLAKLSWLHVLQSDEVQRQHTPLRALVIPSEDDSIYDICRTDPLWTAPQGPSCIPPFGIVLELVPELHQGNGTRGAEVLEKQHASRPSLLAAHHANRSPSRNRQ